MRALHDIYSLEGFEKLTKSLIANLKLLSLIPCIKGIFDTCIDSLEAQKDLYYATMSIGCTAEFFGKDDAGNWRFKLPKKDLIENAIKILYLIGNYCETAKFFQRYKVFSFSTCTQLSNTFGNYSVFNWRLDDIPVIQTLFNKPKDFFIFTSSLLECIKCCCIDGLLAAPAKGTTPAKETNWEGLIKVTSSFGKMVLIASGRNYNQFLWFAIADVITQLASLISLVYKRAVERERRFDNPQMIASS